MDANLFVSLYAPAKTPPEIAERLNKVLAKILQERGRAKAAERRSAPRQAR